MPNHTLIEALQLSISPVILISACGMLLLVMTNRLGRAIDRARTVARSSEPDRIIRFDSLLKRARVIRSAILFSSICILLTGLLILPLFMSTLLPFDVTRICALLFLSSILSLVVSVTFFICDVFLALRDLQAEGKSIHKT
ncbi:MAG: DUF2721 domain-containing protein [Gemmataceae bacterium]